MKNTKLIVVGLFLLVLVLGYFYYISNVKDEEPAEESVTATEVQEVLMRDMNNRYPPTPKEVVKFFAEITRCLLNNAYNDEDLKGMARQLQLMYDEELLAANPFDKYVQNLQFDIQSMRDNNLEISSYVISDSLDVEYYSIGSDRYAKLHCIFSVRGGPDLAPPADHIFLLRRDADRHWKIVGWQLPETVGADNTSPSMDSVE